MKTGENKWESFPMLKVDQLPPSERIKFGEQELKELEIKYPQQSGSNFSADWLSNFPAYKFGNLLFYFIFIIEQAGYKQESNESSKFLNEIIDILDIKITKKTKLRPKIPNSGSKTADILDPESDEIFELVLEVNYR